MTTFASLCRPSLVNELQPGVSLSVPCAVLPDEDESKIGRLSTGVDLALKATEALSVRVHTQTKYDEGEQSGIEAARTV